MLEIDELRKHSSIGDLYQFLLDGQLRPDGDQLSCVCPFHDEKTPSFKVRNEKGALKWLCHGRDSCGGGDIVDFVKRFREVSFEDAKRRVQAWINAREWEGEKQAVENVFKALPARLDRPVITYSLAKYHRFEQALADNREAQEWLLRERGITYETAKRLHFGYRQDLAEIAAGLDIAAKGWISIPCIQGDTVLSIEYRSIQRKEFRRQPGMATPLFNVDTIDALEPVYVTEGKFDAAILEQNGHRAVSLPNATTKLTPEMKDQLAVAYEIILAGDNDDSGRQKMEQLQKELPRTIRIEWPAGVKDANQAYLNGTPAAFQQLVSDRTKLSRANPMPGVYDLKAAMQVAGRTELADHPNRLRFPWPSVDNMAILLPGSVTAVFATNTKMGKSCWVMNATVQAAIRQGETVLNYQCELSPDEFGSMVAAYLTHHDRNHLTPEIMQHIGPDRLGEAKYYIGYDPVRNTVGLALDLIEAAVKRFGATIVILDHLHFLCRNERDPIKAQADAMQRIKLMAVKYGLKFIVVGQARKAEQKTKGKMVHITDAKGSETFASDADAVFAIHRDPVNRSGEEAAPEFDYNPVTEIHLLGVRSKGDGASMAKLFFNGKFAEFEELTYVDEHGQFNLSKS